MIRYSLFDIRYSIISSSGSNDDQGQEFLEKSRKAMAYAIKALRRDYSWSYGERHHHQFVDNFHTGFNLVALHDWMESTGDHRWQEQLLGAYHLKSHISDGRRHGCFMP